MPLKNRGTLRLKRGWLFRWGFFFFLVGERREEGGKGSKNNVAFFWYPRNG